MPFLNEAGLRYLIGKINVRSSETLPENATDGTIIINPKEDIKVMNIGNGSGGNITVDSFLSSSSKNPVENRVIQGALDNKLDKNGTAANSLKVNNLTVETAVPPNAKFTDTIYTHPASHPASMITGLSDVAKTGSYNDLTNKPTVVKTVNNITPDINGNVNVAVSGGGGSTSIVIDPVLSNTSTNAIQNKAVYAALANKMDKTAIADKAQKDSLGNVISDTYAKKTDINGMVKSVNNITPDSNGNVQIAVGSTDSNITVDTELSDTSINPVQNKIIKTALDDKASLSKTNVYTTECIARKEKAMTLYSESNTEGYTGRTKLGLYVLPESSQTSYFELSSDFNNEKYSLQGTNKGELTWNKKNIVRSINNIEADKNGNVNITIESTGSNIAVDSELSDTSTNPVQNKVVKTALDKKMNLTGGENKLISLNTETYGAVTKIGSGRLMNAQTGALLSIENGNESSNGVVTYKGVELATKYDIENFAKISEKNTWAEEQTLNYLSISHEKYNTFVVNGVTDTPIVSTMTYTVTGAFTLNLATLASRINSNQSSIFSAYFTSSADYALSIINAGTIKYMGDASDSAIASTGLLLNIYMTKDSNGNLTSIVQANKLEN